MSKPEAFRELCSGRQKVWRERESSQEKGTCLQVDEVTAREGIGVMSDW